MYWHAADVAEAEAVAAVAVAAVAAAACALVVAREGAAAVIAEVVALAADTAALGGHLRCRARPLAHRP